MHLVGLGYKLLKHGLRTFVVRITRVDKVAVAGRSSQITSLLLPHPLKKKTTTNIERRMVVFERLERT